MAVAINRHPGQSPHREFTSHDLQMSVMTLRLWNEETCVSFFFTNREADTPALVSKTNKKKLSLTFSLTSICAFDDS